MKTPGEWVPRNYHERQVTALETRIVQAEGGLIDLLTFIDPDILQRNGGDWLAAVRELIPESPRQPTGKKKNR